MQTKKKLEKQDIQEGTKFVFCNRELIICTGMMFFYQFAGYNVVTNFAGTILQQDEKILLNITNATSPGKNSQMYVSFQIGFQ